MRELNQQTARVLNEIKRYERPGLFTKHGRFDLMIVPLRPGQISSQMLAEMARGDWRAIPRLTAAHVVDRQDSSSTAKVALSSRAEHRVSRRDLNA